MISQAWQIFGTVQGVGFRWGAQRLAHNLGLSGWVHNEADGTVKLEVQGKPSDIAVFYEQIKAGPTAMAKVDKIEVRDIPLFEANDFEIK